MKSLRDLYKIGKGPSSSHTIGPERAARKFLERAPEADRFTVILYGSLSKTGPGHGTARGLKATLGPDRTEIVFSAEDPADLPHPNTMDFIAYKGESELLRMRVISVGGGDIVIEGEPEAEADDVYPESSFAEITQFCRWRYITLPEYVELNEGPEIRDFLKTIWNTPSAGHSAGARAAAGLRLRLCRCRAERCQRYRRHRAHLRQLRRAPGSAVIHAEQIQPLRR